jgi:hypothetical protein
MNPLIFIPSPRDIPEVKKQWHNIKYDKYIVKYTPQLEAYTKGKQFFKEHEEYTHFIIMPDDLEVYPSDIERLIINAKIDPDYVHSGMCNIDETRLQVFNIQPLGCDFTRDHPPSQNWYNTETKNYKGVDFPDSTFFQVGFVGFALTIIPRDVLLKASWVGASHGGHGNFDWQFCRDCDKMGVPIFVETSINMFHRRFEQTKKAKQIASGEQDIGYTVWLKDR